MTTRKAFFTLLTVLVLVFAASSAHAEEIGGLDLDSFDSDTAAKAVLDKRFPAGAAASALEEALSKSIPALQCQTAQDMLTCSGQSMFGAGFIVTKNWTVIATLAEGKVRSIAVKSMQEVSKDQSNSKH